jgi:hypothetical protein
MNNPSLALGVCVETVYYLLWGWVDLVLLWHACKPVNRPRNADSFVRYLLGKVLQSNV